MSYNETETDGYKHDVGKPDFSLIPLCALAGVARVMQYGNTKYRRDSWRDIPDARNRLLAAMLRHLSEHQYGNRMDDESGLPHIDHVVTNAIMLAWHCRQPVAPSGEPE